MEPWYGFIVVDEGKSTCRGKTTGESVYMVRINQLKQSQLWTVKSQMRRKGKEAEQSRTEQQCVKMEYAHINTHT